MALLLRPGAVDDSLMQQSQDGKLPAVDLVVGMTSRKLTME